MLTDIFYLGGFVLGLCLVLVFGWLFMVVGTAAMAVYQKRNVREAIQPLLDEF
ncbi:hypothetical protein [Marinomonas hwangdonensis]|uniref:hypothetical protein n=1 Tax=Marinomonas hwangdonensis TaxID=1053647 RepID=UPI00131453DA|nr:hypothetical protein [Marinomonas hwangdonensis]